MNHALGGLNALQLGRVLDNDDPEGRGRLQVELQATGMQFWAACMTHSAGQGYGVSCLPRKDEMVVVGFFSPDMGVVLGALWSGQNSQPGEGKPVEDKYSLVSPKGTQITLDDSDGPKLTLQTPAGHHMTITESGSGEVTIEKGAESIRMTASGIKLQTAGNVEIQATKLQVTAPMVQVDAGMSRFSGVVQCDTLIATSVVGTSYTPGAGNIW